MSLIFETRVTITTNSLVTPCNACTRHFCNSCDDLNLKLATILSISVNCGVIWNCRDCRNTFSIANISRKLDETKKCIDKQTDSFNELNKYNHDISSSQIIEDTIAK